MAEEKTFPMTLEGKKKLEEELEDLKTNKRAEVIKRIKIARSFGDFEANLALARYEFQTPALLADEEIADNLG